MFRTTRRILPDRRFPRQNRLQRYSQLQHPFSASALLNEPSKDELLDLTNTVLKQVDTERMSPPKTKAPHLRDDEWVCHTHDIPGPVSVE